jgi:hypothetical protein
LRSFTDDELLHALKGVVERDRCAQADLLEHLAEVDARGLFRREGYASMYRYCTQFLNFSEGAAYHRIAAARAARKYPAVLQRVRSGELHVSGVATLAPHLTTENHLALLEAAKHKTKREIQELIADQRPKPDAAPIVRRMPPPASGSAKRSSRPWARERNSHDAARAAPMAEPLGRDRFKVQFTDGRGVYEKLKKAQALLRHAIPDGDLEEVFDRALTLLIEDVECKRFGKKRRSRRSGAGRRSQEEGGGQGQVEKSALERPLTVPEDEAEEPRRTPSRHIPAEIRRAVFERDEGRCTFLAWNGHRCNEREFLEFHHVEPWARSRRHSEDGIVLICHAHNQYMAERSFGALYIEHRRRARPGEPEVTIAVPGDSCAAGPDP